MGNWDVSKPNKDGERELIDRAVKALEAELATTSKLVASEDAISRSSIKQKLQEHHDFYVKAYGGFSNLPQNDKSRVDEINACIAMVVNEPSVTPKQRTGHWILVSDGIFGGYWTCSECLMHKRMSGRLDSFCSCCGVDMRESEDKE